MQILFVIVFLNLINLYYFFCLKREELCCFFKISAVKMIQADASKTSVTGLKGCKRLDKPYEDPANPIEGQEDRLAIVLNTIQLGCSTRKCTH